MAREDNEYLVPSWSNGEVMSITSLTSPLSFEDVAEKMSSFGIPEQVRRNRIRISTTPDLIRDAIRTAQDSLSCDHIVTISTADIGEMLELQYHMSGPHRMIISFVLTLPRDRPEAPRYQIFLLPQGFMSVRSMIFSGLPFQDIPT